MQPLDALPEETLRGLAGIFTDIDDTLTAGGKLEAPAYRAICDARAAGLRVVAVTGRPGGWAEVLAELWPVDAVIAENGGLAVLDGGAHRYWDPPELRREQRAKLAVLRDDLLSRLRFAKEVEDQPLRRVDSAWDVGEHQHLDAGQIAELCAAIHSHGARSLVSTVHAHAFFGDHDKAKMSVRIARERFGDDQTAVQARYVYIGDSPNDQAGFAFFPLSVGVANVTRYADRLDPLPAFVTTADRGRGFAELVDRILVARGSATTRR